MMEARSSFSRYQATWREPTHAQPHQRPAVSVELGVGKDPGEGQARWVSKQLRPEALAWVVERTGATLVHVTSLGWALVPLWLQDPNGTHCMIPRQRDI